MIIKLIIAQETYEHGRHGNNVDDFVNNIQLTINIKSALVKKLSIIETS